MPAGINQCVSEDRGKKKGEKKVWKKLKQETKAGEVGRKQDSRRKSRTCG